MNGWTRFGGYLGLTALVGAVAMLVTLPGGGWLTPEAPLRDQAGVAAIAGYILIAARLFYLTVHGDARRTRVLSGLGMMLMIVGAGSYIGMALPLLTTAPAHT